MSDSLFSVAGQIVLVSGGSRGIGEAIARGFAEHGSQVVISGREQSTLEAVAAGMSGAHDVACLTCDVAQPEDIESLVANVLERFGRIDTLINVAGVNRRKPTEDVTEDDYDFILDINLKGAFLLSQKVGQHMLETGRGSQINIESLNTYAPLKGVTPYAMSKGGMQMMTRSLALEWGPRGVRVNSLAPGFILTDLTKKLWSDPTMHSWGETNTPLGRLGVPDDMIGTSLFLASDASAFMTGQVLYVDGGFSAGVNWPIPL